MSFYDQSDINKINVEYRLINSRYFDITMKLEKLCIILKNGHAKEYMRHGVMRRLGILMRSIENIFSIFPVQRSKLLTIDELKDVDINLHAFFVNIFGLLDNSGFNS